VGFLKQGFHLVTLMWFLWIRRVLSDTLGHFTQHNVSTTSVWGKRSWS